MTEESKLKKGQRKRPTQEDDIKVAAQEVEESAKEPAIPNSDDVDFTKNVSTGSTLLDLIVSGGKTPYGGMPGGVIAELYGPSSSGKTAVLSEACASCQSRNGDIMFLDPEARLDKDYCETYGLHIDDRYYHRPDTVSEMFDTVWKWEPASNEVTNVIAADSLAALSTQLEMESEDKMGMRRAKEFSEGLRKTCRLITNNNWLLFCSNQIREGGQTPGGKAIGFYSSVRIHISRTDYVSTSKEPIKGAPRKQRVIGIRSDCTVKKSSIDAPFRSCPLFIIFNYGIDDIRGNLQWMKEVKGASTYDAIDKSYQSMVDAVNYIEKNDLEEQLQQKTIELWHEIEESFKVNRKKKKRK